MTYATIADALCGATISSIECKPGSDQFTVVTDRGRVIIDVNADCCSTSWVDSIELPCDDIAGATIHDIENLDGREVGPKDCKVLPEYPDCIKAYQTLLKTNKGTVAIEYRNNSNGYYYGYLTLRRVDP